MNKPADWEKAGEHDPAFGPPEYWGSTRSILEELNDRIAGLESDKESYRKSANELAERIARTEAELDEIKTSYAEIMAEPCEGDDRVHCACVPVLRKELKDLRDKVALLVDAARDCSDTLEAWKNNDKFSSIDEEAIMIVRNAIAEVISKKEDKNGNSDKTI